MWLRPRQYLCHSFVGFILLAVVSIPVTASSSNVTVDFTQCQTDILNNPLAFWVDENGRQTNNRDNAVGTNYETCKAHCGTAPASFHWSSFSPQFTGWLLPFLALTAQLPYQSNGIWHDLMSLFLTIGSPQLAMYSLALTLLNSRYIKHLLESIPKSKYEDQKLQNLKTGVLQTFRFSQQEPFGLTVAEGEPLTNDFDAVVSWWHSTHQSLDKSARWFTASLATQSAWALIAFAFTWVDAFGPRNIGTNVTAFGLAIALCWSWVAVIVLGWFFAGVSCSKEPMSDAIDAADERYPTASLRLTPYKRSHTGLHPSSTVLSRHITGDAEHSGPIYNYARVFVWSHTVYHTIEIIRQQMIRHQRRAGYASTVQTPGQGQGLQLQFLTTPPPPLRPPESVQFLTPPASESAQFLSTPPATESAQFLSTPPNAGSAKGTPTLPPSRLSMRDDDVRALNLSQIELAEENKFEARYSWGVEGGTTPEWKRDVHTRMAWSLLCAVVLNVATVGAAFGLDFATPSIGLGCRSGGVLIYWIVSWAVLVLLVLAAWLADQWSVHEAAIQRGQITREGESRSRRVGYRLLGVGAVVLRLLGKTLAMANSVWIVLHCFFEFTQFYNQCYCLTNRGTTPWLFLTDERIRDIGNTERYWGLFAGFTGVTCTIYILFMGVWAAKRL
ncbi:hypothetical protein FRC19_010965 [Serendipita sp. 401]|nr:hypothetical protein FRC19_010965 [Serendipita sp. 401]